MKITRRTMTAGMTAALSFTNVAHATEYFTLEAVKRQLFPEATSFDDATFMLSKTQRKAISKQSRTRVRFEKVTLYRAVNDGQTVGFVVIDEVYGKHEFITYAIGLTPDRAVKQIEIMRYLETYGGEVRNLAWRAQFAGKRAGDVLTVKKDIANISGATLSCVHISEGVRRILATLELVYAG